MALPFPLKDHISLATSLPTPQNRALQLLFVRGCQIISKSREATPLGDCCCMAGSQTSCHLPAESAAPGNCVTCSPTEGWLMASEAGKELIPVLMFRSGTRCYVDPYFPNVAIGVRRANLDKQSVPPAEDSFKISFLFMFGSQIIASPMSSNTR